MTYKVCQICGKPITDERKIKYCSFECQRQSRIIRSKEFQQRKQLEKKIRKDPELKHGEGYGCLAQAVVNTAIEDIRACSERDIRNYEDPAYRIKHDNAKMRNYYEAKEFLLSERMTGMSKFDGPSILNMLMKEKGKG